MRIVHVVKVGLPSEDDLEGIIDVGEFTQKLRHLGQTLLDKAADTARRAGVEPETGLLDAKKNRVAAILGEEAARWQADLVVMGRESRFRILVDGERGGRIYSRCQCTYPDCSGIVRRAPRPVITVGAHPGSGFSRTRAQLRHEMSRRYINSFWLKAKRLDMDQSGIRLE